MKRVILIAAAFACCAGTARGANPMASLFGNTLTVVGPEGTTVLWYKPDNTFTGIDEKSVRISGTWQYAADELCSFVTTPVPKEKHCGRLGPHSVGDKWEATRPNGAKVHLSLTAGT